MAHGDGSVLLGKWQLLHEQMLSLYMNIYDDTSSLLHGPHRSASGKAPIACHATPRHGSEPDHAMHQSRVRRKQVLLRMDLTIFFSSYSGAIVFTEVSSHKCPSWQGLSYYRVTTRSGEAMLCTTAPRASQTWRRATSLRRWKLPIRKFNFAATS